MTQYREILRLKNLGIVKRHAVVGTNDELKSAVLCSRRHARVGNGAFSAA